MDTVAHEGGIVMLPPPEKNGVVSVEAAIAQRRSVRSFANEPMGASLLSQLLFAAQGITDTSRMFRSAPSAGATFPLEVYCVTRDGVFRYLPSRHALKKIKEGDQRAALATAALGQGCVRQAPVSIVLAAVFSRTTGRYGERGLMYVHMEAGHAAQNILLQAAALKLGSVPVGAFDEESVHALLGCGREERPVYIIAVGRPAK